MLSDKRTNDTSDEIEQKNLNALQKEMVFLVKFYF